MISLIGQMCAWTLLKSKQNKGREGLDWFEILISKKSVTLTGIVYMELDLIYLKAYFWMGLAWESICHLISSDQWGPL